MLRRAAAGSVLANDAGPRRRPLTARPVKEPAKGALTLDPDGSFACEPARDFHATVSFADERSARTRRQWRRRAWARGGGAR